MKQTLLSPNSHRSSRVGAILLAVSLLAGPSLASPSFAVEPSPAPAPSPSQGTAKPAAPAAPTSPAPATATRTPQERAAMAAAVGPGGAEMGQQPTDASDPAQQLKGGSQPAQTLEGSRESAALGAQSTWSPSFGIKGLDVSGHQPSVNWQQQWNLGARFAYVKATEGNYFTNGSFSSQYEGSRSAGMIRGAYHFAIPNWSSGADQARYFVRNGGGWSADGHTLPPVLDFEFNPYEYDTISGFYFGNTCYDMSPAQLASWVRD
ncbi:MAG: lysozyme (1,4-beta-N-acetylmuramidase), partial [Pseudarthrobacter sp.]|nr:lysozyme (1,4-beta-N-acetylmuramidase) [Pseudarthrobacter sp.]